VALKLHSQVLAGEVQHRVPVGAGDSPGWAIRPVKPEHYVAAGRSFGLRTISHVWDLAERPYGLAAMTVQELDRWAALCARQADAEKQSGAEPWRSEEHERVGAERRRRTADKLSSNLNNGRAARRPAPTPHPASR